MITYMCKDKVLGFMFWLAVVFLLVAWFIWQNKQINNVMMYDCNPVQVETATGYKIICTE